jgi:hypothetical protein
MHKNTHFGNDFDGETAGRKTIVGKGIIFVAGCFSRCSKLGEGFRALTTTST